MVLSAEVFYYSLVVSQVAKGLANMQEVDQVRQHEWPLTSCLSKN